MQEDRAVLVKGQIIELLRSVSLNDLTAFRDAVDAMNLETKRINYLMSWRDAAQAAIQIKAHGAAEMEMRMVNARGQSVSALERLSALYSGERGAFRHMESMAAATQMQLTFGPSSLEDHQAYHSIIHNIALASQYLHGNVGTILEKTSKLAKEFFPVQAKEGRSNGSSR